MEKLKKMLKDKNRKIENLVVFLSILVITLIIINNIIKEEPKKSAPNYSNAELASTSANEINSDNLEKRL